MTEKNKQKWNEILKFAVTVLTALLGALGVSAGGLSRDFMSRLPPNLFNKLGRIQSGCALFLCRHISFSQHSTFNIQHSPFSNFFSNFSQKSLADMKIKP